MLPLLPCNSTLLLVLLTLPMRQPMRHSELHAWWQHKM